MTREEEQVEREWFRLTSEWRYAGRLELSVLYVRERIEILNSFIHIKLMKRFKNGSDMVKLGSLVTARAAELRTS